MVIVVVEFECVFFLFVLECDVGEWVVWIVVWCDVDDDVCICIVFGVGILVYFVGDDVVWF